MFRFFNFKGPKSWKYYAWNITREIFARRRITIWGHMSAWIKKLKKTDPNFLLKKMGSVYYNFFIKATIWSQIVICCRATNLCIKFSQKLDFLFDPAWPQIDPKPQVLYIVGKLIQFLKKCISQNLNLNWYIWNQWNICHSACMHAE